MHGHLNVTFFVFLSYRFMVYSQLYLAFRNCYMFDYISLNRNTKNLKAIKICITEICSCLYM